MTIKDANLAMVEIVAKGLDELLSRVVFVGGATTAIYLDDEAAPAVRPTDDVDCITEVAGMGDYARLEKRLRALGFQNAAVTGEPICRWL